MVSAWGTCADFWSFKRFVSTHYRPHECDRISGELLTAGAAGRGGEDEVQDEAQDTGFYRNALAALGHALGYRP